jgi:hypothetical protein
VWVGTDDGLIHLTTDDGATWKNVTPAAITAWSRITMLEASHFDAGTAYASVDRHQLQDFEPYVYRTRDMGKTWTRISRGLPADVYVHVVKEDPQRRGLLVAGTERGAFVSFDDGDQWSPLRLNMPVTSVRDFEFHLDDLVVATHGRGFWVIDDASALRQVDASLLAADAHLFRPGDAILALQGGDNGTPTQKDEPQAPQAPNGALIAWWQRGAATGPVTLEILDRAGKRLHLYTSGEPVSSGRRGGGATTGIPRVSPLWREPADPFPSSAGMHRVLWDALRDDARNARLAAAADGDDPPLTPWLLGTFVAKLTVNGKSYTQEFTVRPDPRTESR